MTLSIAQRLILSNTYRILKKVDAVHADKWERSLEIVAHGYEAEYDELELDVRGPVRDKGAKETEQCVARRKRMSMKLSRAERLILMNQYRSLEKLDCQGADEWQHNRELLGRGGQENLECLDIKLRDPLSQDDCKDVADILDMYYHLQLAAKKHEFPEGPRQSQVRFPGFDNSDFRAYAQFCLRERGKWQDLELGNEDMHSGTMAMPTYRGKLAVWRKCGDPYSLSKPDISRIINAGGAL